MFLKITLGNNPNPRQINNIHVLVYGAYRHQYVTRISSCTRVPCLRQAFWKCLLDPPLQVQPVFSPSPKTP